MKTRQQINDEMNKYIIELGNDSIPFITTTVVDILIDIRDLLAKDSKQ